MENRKQKCPTGSSFDVQDKGSNRHNGSKANRKCLNFCVLESDSNIEGEFIPPFWAGVGEGRYPPGHRNNVIRICESNGEMLKKV